MKNKNAPKEILLTHFAANEKEVAYGSNYEGKKEITELSKSGTMPQEGNWLCAMVLPTLKTRLLLYITG